MENIKSKIIVSAQYSCSQPILYQVSSLIIQTLSENLKEFASFKTKYTPFYLNILKEKLDKAENLANYKTRLMQTEVNYINLCNALSECTVLWQKLKRYIKTTYPLTEQKQHLEEAGHLYYKKSVARNWESAKTLLISTKNFLTRHSSQLIANQNMPEGFTASFVEAYTNFSKCLLTFQQSEKEIKVATVHKLENNNALFATITEICQDGQLIFKMKKDIKEQFVFNTVLHKIKGPEKLELHQSDNTQIPESANFSSSTE